MPQRFWRGLGKASALVDPRAASEVASGSALPCLLYGLSQTPRVVQAGGIGVRDSSAIIIPSLCGGPPALAAHRFGVPLIAVKANTTRVGVPADLLDVATTIILEDYADVIALVACSRAGVSWESIRRPLGSIKDLRLKSHSALAGRALQPPAGNE